jgi:hypothetical protein
MLGPGLLFLVGLSVVGPAIHRHQCVRGNWGIGRWTSRLRERSSWSSERGSIRACGRIAPSSWKHESGALRNSLWRSTSAGLLRALRGLAMTAGCYFPPYRPFATLRAGCTAYSFAPHLRQYTASASCPPAPHAGHAWVEIVGLIARPSSAVTMPVGTAMMP